MTGVVITELFIMEVKGKPGNFPARQYDLED